MAFSAARRNSSEGISHYLRSFGGHKQLTREQEYSLSKRARGGDEEARRILAVSNLPFVVAVARKFASRGARLDDLVQEGNVGLMKAIEHFDSKKNVRFATYAVWWIRAYITRYLKDNRSQVRGGESERASMSDFSLDTPIEEDGDSTWLDRLHQADVALLDQIVEPRSPTGELTGDRHDERKVADGQNAAGLFVTRTGAFTERILLLARKLFVTTEAAHVVGNAFG